MRCRRSDFSAPARQRGAALVLAMLVFALSAALVVAMRDDFQRFYQRNANLLIAEQADAYLRGAEELAAVVLRRDHDLDQENGRRDTLVEDWASPSPPYALEDGGWMRGALQDLQGRFNLNHLAVRPEQEAAGERRFTAAQRQFIRLLQALEEPALSQYEAEIVTESIADWLDGDSHAVANGAEDDYYAGLTPAYRAANRPMASVSELRAVANVTPELYAALAPLVTVWPADPQPLNINTAPAILLRSINDDELFTPLSEDEAESLVAFREPAGFADKTEFLEQPVFQGKNMNEIAALLDDQSSYFLLIAETEVAGRNTRLYSVLQRQNRRVTALARATGSL